MAQFSTINKSVPRVDGEQKVTGAAQYTGDLQLPGLLHARLVLSAHPHARIKHIEREQAAQLPGVVGIYTADDIHFGGPNTGSRNRRPLAKDMVHFDGQPVAIVVATSVAAAQDAVDLVEVEYEELPAATNAEMALTKESPLVMPSDDGAHGETLGHAGVSGGAEAIEDVPANACDAKRFRRGDVDAALAEADLVLERTYRTSWVHQLHLEPQSSAAAPDGRGGMTVWTSTQGAFSVRGDVAAVLELPHHKVNVIAMETGGGFGAKYALIDPLVAAVAWKLKRPVSLIYTRSEELRAANPAPGSIIHVTTGVKKDGTLTALRARILVESGAYKGETLTILCILIGGSYRWPNIDISGYEVLTHKTGSGAYRAPGAPQAAFAIEGQMAEMAQALGLDPLEFRLKNAAVEGDLLPTGQPLPSVGSVEVLRTLAEHPVWKNRQQQPGEGVGISFAWWPGAMQAANAACRLNEDGSLSVMVGSTDISGSNTSLAMIAAEAFGIPFDKVDIHSLDTASAPFAGPSGGSKTLYTVGPAVQNAAQEARKQALAIAAQQLEVAPEDLEIVNGEVGVRGAPGRSISLLDIAQVSMGWGKPYEPVLGRGGSAITTPSPGFAAHLARVSVDQETGLVKVLEYVAVQDVGNAINPAEVEGQIHGGVVQGIGFALYEAIPYGEDGRLMGSSLMDYALPTADKIPPIQTVLVEKPSPFGPYGAKGVGEPPIVPGAAVVANAILAATGVRPLTIPMTPPRVLEALENRQS